MKREVLAELLKAEGRGHSGQAQRDPESRVMKKFWIPASAGMTEQAKLARASIKNFSEQRTR